MLGKAAYWYLQHSIFGYCRGKCTETFNKISVGEGSILGPTTFNILVLEREMYWDIRIRCWRRQHIGTYNIQHCGVGEGSALGHSTIRCWGRQHFWTYIIQHLGVAEGSVLGHSTQ